MKQVTIVLATHNPDKVREIENILPTGIFDLLSLVDFHGMKEIEEDGDTLLENALKKARFAFQLTGMPSLAEDTGLEVDALDGAPGVHSRRFSGENATNEKNNRKLLERLIDTPWEKRTARFRTVVAFVDEKTEHCEEGICEGIIHTELQGGGGFGYDPLFYIPEKGKTFSEMTAAEKNAISHRGRGFIKMVLFLDEYYKKSL